MDNRTCFLSVTLISVAFIVVFTNQLLDAPIPTIFDISQLNLLKPKEKDGHILSVVSKKIKTLFVTGNTTKSTSQLGYQHCNKSFLSKHYMTLTGPKGRLGNQMFQLLSLLGTAINHCYTPVITGEFVWRLGDLIDLSFIGKITKIPEAWTIFNDRTPSFYAKGIQNLSHSTNYSLTGFYQSWRYFDHHKPYITSVIKFKKGITKAVVRYLNSTSQFRSKTKICVHNRRGDFLRERHIEAGFTIAGIDYIERAMQYFTDKLSRKSIVFIILSNDIDWCKENIKNDTGNVFFSPFSESDSADSVRKDYVLLTNCDHCIITGGTFGWTAAWLADGHVVYYKGYPKPGSRVEKRMNKTDYYPPHWVGMM